MKLETSQRSEALQALENALPKSTLLCDTMSDNALAQVIGVLIDGNSLPASFIANALRMSLQATRFHLRILEEANLVVAFECGRHRYYEIVAGDTAERLENILGILDLPDRRSTCMRKKPAFAEARRCYKHLAGAFAVEITDAFQKGGLITHDGAYFRLESAGQRFFDSLGIPFARNTTGAVLTKRCIDVTHRRAHLGGPLGNSLLDWMLENSWLWPESGQRTLHIPSQGRTELRRFLRIIRNGKYFE